MYINLFLSSKLFKSVLKSPSKLRLIVQLSVSSVLTILLYLIIKNVFSFEGVIYFNLII